MQTTDGTWIFGYGSLLWRPAFPHLERQAGWIRGWSRRFWQGSTDHRGVPEAPGRVVTLVPDPAGVCWGLVYRVSGEQREAVLRGLDQREQGGFERREVDVHAADGQRGPRRALVYVAGPRNPNYLGPAPLDEIAAQVRRSRGPSGTNAEYVLRLAQVLRELGGRDPHVEALAARLGPS
jgi:cation transport regulator ChaC